LGLIFSEIVLSMYVFSILNVSVLQNEMPEK